MAKKTKPVQSGHQRKEPIKKKTSIGHSRRTRVTSKNDKLLKKAYRRQG